MKKILITILPFVLGLIVALIIDFPKNAFYFKNANDAVLMIFVVNSTLCLAILLSSNIISSIIYAYNLFFIGIIVYIMIFIMNDILYFHAPIEIFTLVYTYIYARKQENKKRQMTIILIILLISAIIEGALIYV